MANPNLPSGRNESLQNCLKQLTPITNVINSGIHKSGVNVEERKRKRRDSADESFIGNNRRGGEFMKTARVERVKTTRSRHGGKQPCLRPASSARKEYLNYDEGQYVTFDDLEGPRTVLVGESLFNSEGGTFVAVAECTCLSCEPTWCSWAGKDVVVKCHNTMDHTRIPGEYLIDFVREYAEDSSGEEWALAHLPLVLEKLGNRDFRGRLMRITIYERLYPISDLVDPREIAQVFYDILQIHQWLFDHPGILHRDINLDNIMFRRIDGDVYGVLNDFDLACRVNPSWNLEDGPSPNGCTGTKPFMAHDLLSTDQKRHMPRHDMESLFYAMLILICCYQRPGLMVPEPMPFLNWFNGTEREVHDAKLDFILRPINLPVQPHFCGFRAWIRELYSWLHRGHAEGRQHDDLCECRDGVDTNVDQDTEDSDNSSDTEDVDDMEEENVPFNWYTLNGEFSYERMKFLMSFFQARELETRS
ncbi:hypothetical protein GGU10DRAFT_409469 [Lentinula aff. detonsa]|uniref:Protein kinase domain-containing protein n=1 Tax=Lentinula aff. detonsa TaxID=2804958 RepID=A0AA38NLH6_9AGAR|nr:hypothetical protein GGU10DRAFT_409469 [Lentinula aff. detonsa]